MPRSSSHARHAALGRMRHTSSADASGPDTSTASPLQTTTVGAAGEVRVLGRRPQGRRSAER
jgi:hypothetical protein